MASFNWRAGQDQPARCEPDVALWPAAGLFWRPIVASTDASEAHFASASGRAERYARRLSGRNVSTACALELQGPPPIAAGRQCLLPLGACDMPTKATLEKARKAKREGKAPSTQAGAFVHEEIEKVRRGDHGARSPQQAIAIGLSEARRAGIDLPPPAKGETKEKNAKKRRIRL